MEHQPSVMERHTPFLFNVHYSEVNGLLSRCIVRKLNFGLSIPTDALVQIIDGICSIHDFADLHREVKVAGKILPVVLPGLDRMSVFGSPLFRTGSQRMFCS